MSQVVVPSHTILRIIKCTCPQEGSMCLTMSKCVRIILAGALYLEYCDGVKDPEAIITSLNLHGHH